jgi:cobalamin biosynthesis protein CobD/CbiB
MENAEKKINATIDESNKWMIFGALSPVLFSLSFVILFYFNIIDISYIVYVAVAFAIVICFVWWFWALKVIVEMSELNLQANKDLTEMRKDVKIIAHEVRESTRDLFVFLDAIEKKEKK